MSAAWQARVDLAAAYNLCDKLGLNEGICNHLSALVPGTTDHFLVIRYGLLWSEVTPDNLVVVDASGAIVEGEGPVEVTALRIHAAVHQADPLTATPPSFTRTCRMPPRCAAQSSLSWSCAIKTRAASSTISRTIDSSTV